MRYNVYTNLKGDISMNVSYKYLNTVEFGTLEIGDTFIYGGEPYLKLEETYTSDEWRRNAFGFDTCKVVFFDHSTMVKPVKADITIKIWWREPSIFF